METNHELQIWYNPTSGYRARIGDKNLLDGHQSEHRTFTDIITAVASYNGEIRRILTHGDIPTNEDQALRLVTREKRVSYRILRDKKELAAEVNQLEAELRKYKATNRGLASAKAISDRS